MRKVKTCEFHAILISYLLIPVVLLLSSDLFVLYRCKFVCTTYWATQFHAVREAFLSQTAGSKDPSGDATGSSSGLDVEQAYVLSLSSAYSWAASGGKSGASFARTQDDRFVIKCISRTELQMFLDCAPAYFEYLSKAFFHGL
jgi:1-phosphatidylinositol-3-phosphate 5-kinase